MEYESISFMFHNFTISANYTYIYMVVYMFLQNVGLNRKKLNRQTGAVQTVEDSIEIRD